MFVVVGCVFGDAVVGVVAGLLVVVVNILFALSSDLSFLHFSVKYIYIINEILQ